MKELSVERLIELLSKAPKGCTVVVRSCDHSYRPAHAEITAALFAGGTITEDHGEDLTPEIEYGQRAPVVVIG